MPKIKRIQFSNSVCPVEVAHNELPQLDIHYLNSQYDLASNFFFFFLLKFEDIFFVFSFLFFLALKQLPYLFGYKTGFSPL